MRSLHHGLGVSGIFPLSFPSLRSEYRPRIFSIAAGTHTQSISSISSRECVHSHFDGTVLCIEIVGRLFFNVLPSYGPFPSFDTVNVRQYLSSIFRVSFEYLARVVRLSGCRMSTFSKFNFDLITDDRMMSVLSGIFRVSFGYLSSIGRVLCDIPAAKCPLFQSSALIS